MGIFRIDDLLLPSAFAHPADRLVMHETHLSWVILAGDYAYKIKKAVRFDFIDATSLARREQWCRDELRLNQRLAPQLYLEVVPITWRDGACRIGGAGEALEYAVRMRRFDTDAELASLLDRGAAGVGEIAALGELLAHFHARAARAAAGDACTQALRRSVLKAVDSLLQHEVAHRLLPELDDLVGWLRTTLAKHSAALARREAGGRVRECHGDLHARNIVRWQGELTPFDCLEFDPALRWIDVMNDIAFLYMDLQSHRRSDLACTLMNAWLEHNGDYAGLPLLPLYAAYRAIVRAMVDALAMEQAPERRQVYEPRLQARLRTAAGCMHAGPAALLIMHGASGSGKSWLSSRLLPSIPAIRIRSDVERKRLFAGGEGVTGGLYGADANRRTYAHLLECAEHCLDAGLHTLVDAAFLEAGNRRLFQSLAAARGARFVILSCEADRATLAARIRGRQLEGRDPSDADVTVMQRQLRHLQSLDAQELPFTVRVDTGGADPVGQALDAIRRLLDSRDPPPPL